MPLKESDAHRIITQEARENFRQTRFLINSFALVEYKGKKESTLHAKRRGPYRVVTHIGAVYTQESLVFQTMRLSRKTAFTA